MFWQILVTGDLNIYFPAQHNAYRYNLYAYIVLSMFWSYCFFIDENNLINNLPLNVRDIFSGVMANKYFFTFKENFSSSNDILHIALKHYIVSLIVWLFRKITQHTKRNRPREIETNWCNKQKLIIQYYIYIYINF